MSLSRMENTTFAMPSIIDSHDMGLRTVFTVRTPKGKRLFNATCCLLIADADTFFAHKNRMMARTSKRDQFPQSGHFNRSESSGNCHYLPAHQLYDK
ncbi:hypothetical protein TNCV_3867701 [Trichonephila clavipes]|nr:hypothetical protein TNCV_3867701 [Trichonephila clavipes]